MIRLVVVGAMLAAASPALADQVTLGRTGMDSVYVWLDSEAHSEALKLIAAGVHETKPQMILALLSCIATPGDHAVVLDQSWGSARIVIVDGAKSGCRGNVAVEDIR